MAKKAQVSGKASAKVKTKPAGKTHVAAKKPGKASASAKAMSPAKSAKAKPPEKMAAKVAPSKKAVVLAAEKKQAINPVAEIATKKAVSAVKPVAKTKSEKAALAAETAEKVKIDKSMTEEQAKWAEMYNKYKDAQVTNYDMKATFKAASPIQHKVLGWGWIVSNENDRLEVLFKDGKRMLISNYRS